MLSDTFAGISPASVPMFLACQAVGGALGYLTARSALPAPKDRTNDRVSRSSWLRGPGSDYVALVDDLAYTYEGVFSRDSIAAAVDDGPDAARTAPPSSPTSCPCWSPGSPASS